MLCNLPNFTRRRIVVIEFVHALGLIAMVMV